eukprot:TRINITY_DN789_c0_g1_i1.p1 TRINITY_DN789_c0_g1~~TRINITY_DN789_c0_g1_i1.p1  ORF type:complete len:211 (-),score=72.14 TRINITY_DN789_c0_g1_i1:70-675(-)
MAKYHGIDKIEFSSERRHEFLEKIALRKKKKQKRAKKRILEEKKMQKRERRRQRRDKIADLYHEEIEKLDAEDKHNKIDFVNDLNFKKSFNKEVKEEIFDENSSILDKQKQNDDLSLFNQKTEMLENENSGFDKEEIKSSVFNLLHDEKMEHYSSSGSDNEFEEEIESEPEINEKQTKLESKKRHFRNLFVPKTATSTPRR